MSDLSGLHDPTGGQVAKGFDKGWHTLCLVKSEMLESKKNPGNWYLECEFEIEDTPRRIWERYNLKNSSQKAQEIAWRDFNSLKHACGKLNVNDSSELHGIPFRGNVGFEKGDPDKLKIVSGGYKPLNADAGGHSTQQSSGSANSGGGGQPSSAPWNQQRSA